MRRLHNDQPLAVFVISSLAVLALLIVTPRGAYAQKTIRKQETVMNKSAAMATGLLLGGKVDPPVATQFTAATAYFSNSNIAIWESKALDPAKVTFEWKKAELKPLITGVNPGVFATIDYQRLPVPANQVQKVGIDRSFSVFTANDVEIRDSLASLSTAQSIEFQGNIATVSIKNLESMPVELTGLVVRRDNLLPEDSPGLYVPDGTPVIALTSLILLPDETFTRSFEVLDANLPVSISDSVAFSSDPNMRYAELTASSAVPEPSAVTLLGLGSICLLRYAWRRRKLES